MNKYKSLDEIFSNSIIEKEYIKYLENEDIKIISFDIFDTLFFRKCGLPENIFLEMGKNDLVKKLFFDSHNFKNYRINCEKDAYNKSKNEEIFLKDIYDNFSISKKEKNNLLKLELKIENENLFLNEHIYKWIKLAKNYNKKVILISDMYLSLKDIKRIALNKLEKISFIDNIYISSEIGFRKATGKLFEYVLKDNYIKNTEILHIGDNIRSDINIANAIDIKTIFYNYDKNFHNILDNERIYLKDKFISKDHLRFLSYLSNPYKNQEEKFFYEIGSCFFGPILWEFSIWLKEIVDKQKIKQLNFFMREGFTFEKVFNRLFPDIKTSKVEVSRESTNFLNLNLDDLSEVNFNKFKEFKVKDFYVAYFLEINDEKIKSIENELLKNLESIHYITDDILSRKDEIIKNINYQKKALMKYLKNLKINGKSTFIDFGGGATVINRLNKKLFNKNYSKIDLLFFLHSEGLKNSLPNRLFSFLPYNDRTFNSIEKIRRTPYFIEILLNGFNHTTNSYKIIDKKVKAIKKETSFFDEKLKKNFEIFYKGVEIFIQIAKENNDLISLYDREYLCLLMARFVALPTEQEVKYLGNLKYDEGKGSDYFYTIVKDNQKSVDLKELYLEYLNAHFRSQYEYPWMEGFITSIEPSLIKKFYGNVKTQNEVAVENILNQIDELSLKEVSIYGAGEIFEMLFPYLKDRDINIKNVIDSRAKINTFKFLDFNVKSLENTNLTEHDIIVIASVVYYDEIKESIVNHNKKLRYI